MVTHEMNRNLSFFDPVGSPGQQRGFGNSVRVSDNHRDDFTVIFSLVGGETGNAGDGELCVGQRLFGQLILLDDSDLPLNRGVGAAEVCRLV